MSQTCKKKLIALCVVILFSLVSLANAEQVTQEMAQQTAQAFLLKEQAAPPKVATKTKGEFIVRNQAAGLALGEIQPITDEHGVILAYVQELEPQGFIIASADDAIRSVLGFSFTDSFAYDVNKSNPLLDLIKADIHARKQSAYVENTTMGLGSSTQWGPWLQTAWHQSGHWNNKCPYTIPYVPLIRRPVGCVATATAQIVNYWEYPKSMSFSQSERFYLSGNPASFADAGTYGFPTASELNTALHNILYNDNSDEEAYLCFGIGVKLHMNYGVFGSGANTYSVRRVLNDQFGFGSAIAYSDRSGVWSLHSLEIVEDVENGWPVQIAIHKSGKTGGHSIVVDGYRDDGFFHLNYGWGAISPDPISTTWYNIPTTMPRYDVVHTVVYGIAKYQGWNQYGADAQNTFGTIYAAPQEITQKWRVSCPENYSISGDVLVGTSNHIYASVNYNSYPGSAYIYVIDKFGSLLREIELPMEEDIIKGAMCQNSVGEIFAATWYGNIYRIDPDKGTAEVIYTEPYDDQIRYLKVDEDGWLYVLTSGDRLHSLSRTGSPRWASPYTAPANCALLACPAIDVSINRVYIGYRNTATQDGYLASIDRVNGQLVSVRNFGRSIAVPFLKHITIGQDGTVYVGARGTLYALDPNDLMGSPKWTKPVIVSTQPAEGRNGTLYFAFWDISGSPWYNKLCAVDASNGSTRWIVPFALDDEQGEHICQPYIAANGIVLFSIHHQDDRYTLHAYKDNGSSAEELWSENAGKSGGSFAFGPGATVYAWGGTGYSQTLFAISNGDVGDPDGSGMDFENNNPPISPSNPSPADGADGQDTVSVQLLWSCSDPDGHALNYDIYACALVEGEEAAFVPVASQVTENWYTLTDLQDTTQYLWSVVATDGQAIAEGPIWSFSTEGPVAVEEIESPQLPDLFVLSQNYPNPFNPETRIEFALPRASHVKIEVFNILGQSVRTLVDERLSAGYKAVNWDSRDNHGVEISSGVYFYRITAGDFVESKKMLLLK